MSVRVRIAPSPTGHMHVGNARTVLFNWLFAKAEGGTFVWRVEDTDRERYVEGALEDFAEGLAWLGIEPDEGPFVGGEYGPYVQSERRENYADAAATLVADGHAYPCFCDAARLEQVREARRAAGVKGPYDGLCRALSSDESAARVAAGEAHTVRLRMPQTGAVGFDDIVLGSVTVAAEDLYDIILLKSDGWPTYHLAVVVDDHAMAISHVIRADEWVSSTPYHVVLYQSFGWQPPVHAHVPLVLNPDGRGKLSKRSGGSAGADRETTDSADGRGRDGADDGARAASGVTMTRVNEYKRAGYLPEAMVNYLCLLGWAFSGDRDLFSLEEAAERFLLTDVSASPARWDMEKLRAINAHYIRAMDEADLAERLVPFVARAGIDADLVDDPRLAAIVPLVRERLITLDDITEWAGFFFAPSVTVAPEELVPPKVAPLQASSLLGAAIDALHDCNPWSSEALEERLRALASAQEVKLGALLQPLRVAVTGSRVAPPLFETLAILGRDASLSRIKTAHALLDQWLTSGGAADMGDGGA